MLFTPFLSHRGLISRRLQQKHLLFKFAGRRAIRSQGKSFSRRTRRARRQAEPAPNIAKWNRIVSREAAKAAKQSTAHRLRPAPNLKKDGGHGVPALPGA
jgi:hypothetical protein